MPKVDIQIRSIVPSDRAQWEPLWRGYLGFYKTTLPPDIYDVTWQRIHDPEEPVLALCAEYRGALIGIAHMIYHRSCWTAGDYCYLQDLFVAETARGLGAGRALIAAVETRARTRGASRLYWLTHETNAPARLLYDQVAERSGFIQYRTILQ